MLILLVIRWGRLLASGLFKRCQSYGRESCECGGENENQVRKDRQRPGDRPFCRWCDSPNLVCSEHVAGLGIVQNCCKFVLYPSTSRCEMLNSDQASRRLTALRLVPPLSQMFQFPAMTKSNLRTHFTNRASFSL
jgi:hypothetical protein